MIFSFEEAPTTGTPHLQGYLQVNNPVELKSLIDWSGPGYHWETCKGSDQDNYDYVTKTGRFAPEDGTLQDFITWGDRKSLLKKSQGQRNDILKVKALIDLGWSLDQICEDHFGDCAKYYKFIEQRVAVKKNQLAVEKLRTEMSTAVLRPWQEGLLRLVSCAPDPRQVYWLWDREGNQGKSWMARYLSCMQDALILEPGKLADLSYIFLKNMTTIVIFDLSRTVAPTGEEGTKSGPVDVIYTMMERLKNGYLISTKYESQKLHFEIPHVVVFANFEPERSKMSADRWAIQELV